MKLLLPIVGAVAMAAAAKMTFFPCDGCCLFGGDSATKVANVAATAPAGRYLEARNVSLWGGPCHLNGEYGTQGDGAIVAWSFESGAFDGVELAGVRAVAALAAKSNLADEGARTSELWIDAPTDTARRAAIAWLESQCASELGTVASVHTAPIAFACDGDRFDLEVDGVCEIEGATMPDRACCSMPEQRGYEPLLTDAGAPVGAAQQCVFKGTANLRGWIYEDANSVFVSSFGAKSEPSCDQGACSSSAVDIKS